MPARRWYEFWKPRDVDVFDVLRERINGDGLHLTDEQIQLARSTSVLTPTPQTPSDHVGFGGSGTPISGVVIGADDYNIALQGRRAIQTYDKMRRGDAQVHATLQVIKLNLLSARPIIVPPADGDTSDEQIAEFVEACLLDDDAMRHTWDFSLRHMLLKLDFGYSVLEKVWEIGPNNELRFHRLAPRLSPSIEEWHVDENGELIEVVQRANKNGREQTLIIPGEYAAVFVHDREGDNFNGISLLRSAFKHWYYKDQLYNIDAIAHERWGVGIPVAKLETNAVKTTANLNAIEKLLEGLRSHHRAYAVEPPGVAYRILTPDGSRSNDGLMASIEHHDVMIARNILAQFMNVGQAPNGTRSSTESLVEVFFTSIEGLGETIAGECKRQLIKPLCDLNFPMQGRQYPSLRFTNIRKADHAALADSLSKLIPTGAITPDADIENMLRQIMGLPPRDPATVSVGATPQAQGGAAGDANSDGTQSRASRSTSRPTSDRPASPAAELSALKSGGMPQLRREATPFELQTMSIAEIAVTLNGAIAQLSDRLARVRQKQVRAAIDRLVEIDKQTPTRPWADLDVESFSLTGEADIEREIKRAQNMLATYGAEQVRLELARQGAPLSVKHPIATSTVALTLDDTLAQAAIGMTKQSARAQMNASAINTAARMNAQLRGVILDEAIRVRRSGVRGVELSRELQKALDISANTNIVTPARNEIHEAFALGRAAEAHAHRALITTCQQSALLDTRTCTECASIDGVTFVYGSEEQQRAQPPYVNCQGRENCRCVQLFVYKGKAN